MTSLQLLLVTCSPSRGKSSQRYTVFSAKEVTPLSADKFERRLEKYVRELARVILQRTIRKIESDLKDQTVASFDARRITIRITIFSLLWGVAIVAILFAGVARWRDSQAAARSDEAEANLQLECGASILDRYVTLMGHSSERDMCGPHIDLSNPRLFDRHIRHAEQFLRDLRPRAGKLHVAVYLHSDFFVDPTLVNELRQDLPHCRFYSHAEHLNFLGWTLTSENQTSTQE